jgi:hypothetical protein
MKKLMTILLGLSFALGTVAFAQDPPKKDEPKKEKKGKGKKSKKAPKEEKKQG